MHLWCFVCLSFLTATQSSPFAEVVYEWVTLDYDWSAWPSSLNLSYNKATASGLFIPDHNIISGIKEYQSRVFVTVPRWRTGVPSTLNEIVPNPSDSSSFILRPFPSSEWQNTSDCSKLQYIQSMEIDFLHGTMWILDTGRKYILEPNATDNSCPPKIVIWDLLADKLISTYTFPSNVANPNNSALNDVVVDPVNGIGYISDTSGVSEVTGQPGALVIYDSVMNASNRLTDDRLSVLSMRWDDIMNATQFDVDGDLVESKTSCDGIALSRDLSWVYYTSLASFRTFRLPAGRSLLNISNYASANDSDIEFLGFRGSQTGGMMMSNTGNLYYGALTGNAVNFIAGVDQLQSLTSYEASMNENSDAIGGNLSLFETQSLNESVLVVNETSLEWVDSFGWDSNGNYLWLTSNKLERFLAGNMAWDGSNGANMRVVKVYIEGEQSYQMYCIDDESRCGSSANKKHSHKSGIAEHLWIVVIAVAVGLTFLLGIVYCMWKRRNSAGMDQDMLLPNGGDFVAVQDSE